MIDVKLTCEPFFGSNFYWLVFFVTGDDRWGENFPRSINGGRPVAKKKKKKVAKKKKKVTKKKKKVCLLYTSPSPRDRTRSRMPSSA